MTFSGFLLPLHQLLPFIYNPHQPMHPTKAVPEMLARPALAPSTAQRSGTPCSHSSSPDITCTDSPRDISAPRLLSPSIAFNSVFKGTC